MDIVSSFGEVSHKGNPHAKHVPRVGYGCTTVFKQCQRSASSQAINFIPGIVMTHVSSKRQFITRSEYPN